MFWKWQCLNDNCKRSFVKPAGYVITLICRYCGSDKGFNLIKTQKAKVE